MSALTFANWLLLSLAPPAPAGLDLEIDAPPAEAKQLEQAVRSATDTTGPMAKDGDAPPEAQTKPPRVQIVRQPEKLSIIIIDPATRQAIVREVPLDGELSEVESQEVAQIVTEAIAAYAQATEALPPPEPLPPPGPIPKPAPVSEAAPIEPKDESPAPRRDAFGRGGFVALGLGPGMHIVRGDLWTTATLNTALSLGYGTDLPQSGAKRRSSPHATFGFRFGTDSMFFGPVSATFYDLWARVRLGTVTGRNFTYAAGAIGASIVSFRGSGDVRFGGSFGMGSQWLVGPARERQHALGFELDFAPYQRFRAVRTNLKLVYSCLF